MSRKPTNFGPYEREYQARVSRLRRLLKGAVQAILAAAAVTLAGVFLFPLNAHAQQVPGALDGPPARIARLHAEGHAPVVLNKR